MDADSKTSNPLAPIVQKLKSGKLAEGIQLLELLLSHRPDDPVVLYNLGAALSDAGRWQRAEECLSALSNWPDRHQCGVALGVLLGRLDRGDEAATELRLPSSWTARTRGRAAIWGRY